MTPLYLVAAACVGVLVAVLPLTTVAVIVTAAVLLGACGRRQC